MKFIEYLLYTDGTTTKVVFAILICILFLVIKSRNTSEVLIRLSDIFGLTASTILLYTLFLITPTPIKIQQNFIEERNQLIKFNPEVEGTLIVSHNFASRSCENSSTKISVYDYLQMKEGFKEDISRVYDPKGAKATDIIGKHGVLKIDEDTTICKLIYSNLM